MDDPPEYRAGMIAEFPRRPPWVTSIDSARSHRDCTDEKHTHCLCDIDTSKDNDKFPFTLVLTHVRGIYIDSKGRRCPTETLKIRHVSVMLHRQATAEDLSELAWEQVYDSFGRTKVPRSEKAEAGPIPWKEEWESMLAGLKAWNDAGWHPICHAWFTPPESERVKSEGESKLSFRLKRLLDRVFSRG